jgi:hypothetical protein
MSTAQIDSGLLSPKQLLTAQLIDQQTDWYMCINNVIIHLMDPDDDDREALQNNDFNPTLTQSPKDISVQVTYLLQHLIKYFNCTEVLPEHAL